jgi:prepilin-type N-terminal cleavage/methylation domain-containing protein
MTVKSLKPAHGFTIVEVMTTIVILCVVIIGTSGYRYYAALDARKAEMQTTASRIGALLCESWRGLKGTETYNPVTQFSQVLAISQNTGFSVAGYKDASFTLLGSYMVSINNTNYCAVLSWKNVATGLRALNVVVVWPIQDRCNVYEPFELTTYTTL